MGQNRSTAVMQNRKEPKDALDDFPTPPWATRALMDHILKYHVASFHTALEPACGRGIMVRPLQDYFARVDAFDVHDYGAGYPVDDFLLWHPRQREEPDWIITNPPFKLAEEFALHALAYARSGVALLLRTSFIEGNRRYWNLFSKRPLTIMAPFVERVTMVKGTLTDKNWSATSYAWFIWTHRHIGGTELKHIPPCRRDLERPGDYDA